MELRAEINPGGIITGAIVFPDIDEAVKDVKYKGSHGTDFIGMQLYDPATITVDQTNKTDLKWTVACDSPLPDDFKEFVVAYNKENASSGSAFTGFAAKMRFFGGTVSGYIKSDGKYRAIRGGWPPEKTPTALLLKNFVPNGNLSHPSPWIPSRHHHQMVGTSTEDHSAPSASVHLPVPTATRNMSIAVFADALDVNGIISLGGAIISDTIQQTSLKYLMAAADYHRGTEETTLFGERKKVHETLLKDSGLDSALDVTSQTWLNAKFRRGLVCEETFSGITQNLPELSHW
jgi:hypothetical protein